PPHTLSAMAVECVAKPRENPWSLFLAHKAVHPDAAQANDGTLQIDQAGGYRVAPRHAGLYKDAVFPPTPNMLPPEKIVKDKPAWREAFVLRKTDRARAVLDRLHAGEQEEIRLRARMIAAVDEGGGSLLEALERTGQLDDTFIVFLGDNGYFFGEHGLGPERRFAYEDGIRSPFLVRYPAWFKPGTVKDDLVLALDIAPSVLDLAGAKQADTKHVQGLSLRPLAKG